MIRLDSYATLVVKEQEYRTRTAKMAGPRPIWNKEIEIDDMDLEDTAKLNVYDAKTDALIGDVTIKISDLCGDPIDTQYNISYEGNPVGKVSLKAQWTPCLQEEIKAVDESENTSDEDENLEAA